MFNHIIKWINNFENMNFMMYWQGIKYLKIFLCFMVTELSQYHTCIAFKQKWVRKDWTLTTMEQMETREIHNYVININKWYDQKLIQWAKFKI
jgi:hypothetical protein